VSKEELVRNLRDGRRLAGERFAALDFRGIDFTRAALPGALFDRCRLRGARWAGANVRGARFRRCAGMTPATIEALEAAGAVVQAPAAAPTTIAAALLSGAVVAGLLATLAWWFGAVG
jgi:uncharacterized protein YjbI with pentapeptide repeats